jgi:hypothetical protein
MSSPPIRWLGILAVPGNVQLTKQRHSIDSQDLSRRCSTRCDDLIRKTQTMVSDWSVLSEPLQLALSREALRRAAETIAGQAELLAEEMECGALIDQGGPDALRLLAAVVRVNGEESFGAVGNA